MVAFGFRHLRWRGMIMSPFLFCLPIFFHFSSGWEILVQEKEEQRGSKTFTRRTAAEGEPDHRARLLPGAGKRGTAAASGRAAERLRPLQEHSNPIRGQVWPTVKNSRAKPTVYQRDKNAELPSPQNSTQTQTPRESKFALLSLLTPSHCVELWVLDTHWQAVRHDGERWSQEGLWRAPGSCTQRGKGYSQGQTHGKYGPPLDGFNHVRKYEKSRQVQKNYWLLNTTQISF